MINSRVLPSIMNTVDKYGSYKKLKKKRSPSPQTQQMFIPSSLSGDSQIGHVNHISNNKFRVEPVAEKNEVVFVPTALSNKGGAFILREGKK